MSDKVELAEVAECASKLVPPETLQAIMDRLMQVIDEKKKQPKEPAIKKQWCILISDPDGLLPKTDFAGWVAQIPEEAAPATLQERIIETAKLYNTTRKGRLNPVATIGEACEFVPSRLFAESSVWVKSKTPVLVLSTDNEVPNPNQGKLFGGAE